MADLAKIVDSLSSLTVLEAAELTKLLETKWGVSAAAPVAMAAAGGGGAAAAAPVEEQTEFNVILTAAGDKKINVIVQTGLRKHADLPDVPFLTEVIKDQDFFKAPAAPTPGGFSVVPPKN